MSSRTDSAGSRRSPAGGAWVAVERALVVDEIGVGAVALVVEDQALAALGELGQGAVLVTSIGGRAGSKVVPAIGTMRWR